MGNRLVVTATSEKGMHKERAMAAMSKASMGGSKAMVATSRARAAMDKAMKPTTRVTASRGKGMADIEQALLQFRQIDVCSPVWLIIEMKAQATHWPGREVWASVPLAALHPQLSEHGVHSFRCAVLGLCIHHHTAASPINETISAHTSLQYETQRNR